MNTIEVTYKDEYAIVQMNRGKVNAINFEMVQELRDTFHELEENTDVKGVDVVYDPVGGAYSEAALRGTAWKGRYLVVGFAAGDIPKIPLNLPLLKGASVIGVFWGAFTMRNSKANMQNTMTLMQWYAEGKLKPHIHAIYDLADTSKALEEMTKRKVKGKLIVQI